MYLISGRIAGLALVVEFMPVCSKGSHILGKMTGYGSISRVILLCSKDLISLAGWQVMAGPEIKQRVAGISYLWQDGRLWQYQKYNSM